MKMAPFLKKHAVPNIPYVIIFFIARQVSSQFDWLQFDDNLVAFVLAVIIRIAVAVKSKNAKKYRKDVEYGSARWSA